MMDQRTSVERIADRELVVTRVFDALAGDVFAAWTTPALMQQWWAPKSMGMTLSGCEMDVRVDGRYRFEFSSSGPEPMAFVGRYVDVVPGKRLVWTNEESDDGAITTVTFDDLGTSTRMVLRETYASTQARDEAYEGMKDCMAEQYDQLDALLQERRRR